MTIKHGTLAALAFSLTALAAPAFATEQKVTLSVPGMTCASCPFIVESAISQVEGVQSVETSLETRSATVVFDDALTSVDTITMATHAAGYDSSPMDATSGS